VSLIARPRQIAPGNGLFGAGEGVAGAPVETETDALTEQDFNAAGVTAIRVKADAVGLHFWEEVVAVVEVLPTGTKARHAPLIGFKPESETGRQSVFEAEDAVFGLLGATEAGVAVGNGELVQTLRLPIDASSRAQSG